MSTLEVKSIRGEGGGSNRRRSEVEGDEEVFEEDNPIPLPPRDRTRPLPPTKPRHTRKHPLVIPVSRALAKMADTAGESVSGGEDTESGCEQGPAKLSVKSMDDSFDQQIACELAALDDIPVECETPDDIAMIRHSDHVSCEDLLEFACDTPNAKRTRGRAQGVSSDEVRIMGKVLGPEVSAEDCVLSLNASEWDVHRAIKLARLHALLQGCQDLVTCNQALDACAWDVARAASWVLANQEQGDTTQV